MSLEMSAEKHVHTGQVCGSERGILPVQFDPIKDLVSTYDITGSKSATWSDIVARTTKHSLHVSHSVSPSMSASPSCSAASTLTYPEGRQTPPRVDFQMRTLPSFPVEASMVPVMFHSTRFTRDLKPSRISVDITVIMRELYTCVGQSRQPHLRSSSLGQCPPSWPLARPVRHSRAAV
jgi:hypothetical protein